MAGIKVKASLGERIFYVINYIFFGALAFAMLAPILNLISKSMSKETAVITGAVGIFPDFSNLQFDTYKLVFENQHFITGFKNTIMVTLIGTVVAIIVTSCAAYTLSKPYLRGRKFLVLLCIFIMIFSGGMIPTYLVIDSLKLTNTFTVLWLLGVFNVYNMLIMKNYFEGIPRELEESATIDGAGQMRIFFQIYLPLSKAVLAVISLFFAVSYWNNFFTSMLYTTRTDLKTLQLVLKEIIYSVSDIFLSMYGGSMGSEITGQSTIAACVVVATLPIVLAYPFLQKHFASGVMTGSVKG
ncbi:MAG: carbohydrate ABC transporter permease [Oscillospiraceae bacterium]